MAAPLHEAPGMRKRSLVAVGVAAVSVYFLFLRGSGSSEMHELADRGPRLFDLERLANNPAGRLDDLGRAMSIAEQHQVRWGELSRERPHRPLTDYPDGEAAIAALGRWARDHGTPPSPSRMSISSLGTMAIDTATRDAPGGLETAQLVGYRLLTAGAGTLDAFIGAHLLERAAVRTRELGLPATTWWIPPRITLARVLAAEILAMRRTFAPSPLVDRTVAYWSDILADADRQTPAEVLARFRANPSDEFLSARTVEELAERIARIQTP